MTSRDRRIGIRVPVEMFLNQYVRDRPFRGLVGNLSETGVLVQRAYAPTTAPREPDRVVALEFELPGTGEVIWARGEIRNQNRDRFVLCDGVHFTAMPRIHARLLRDYCIESRRQDLSRMLERIRRPRAA